MSEHTAGPWMVGMERNKFGLTCYRIFNHIETTVVVAHDGSYWDEDYEPTKDEYGYVQPDDNMDCESWRIAIARLIAAAPDLLKALENLEHTAGLPVMSDDPARVAARAAIAKAKGDDK